VIIRLCTSPGASKAVTPIRYDDPTWSLHVHQLPPAASERRTKNGIVTF
jgi:hypothetical protein